GGSSPGSRSRVRNPRRSRLLTCSDAELLGMPRWLASTPSGMPLSAGTWWSSWRSCWERSSASALSKTRHSRPYNRSNCSACDWFGMAYNIQAHAEGFGGGVVMIEIARERNISAPAARVWEVVAEAERLPEWYARAASVEVLEGAG